MSVTDFSDAIQHSNVGERQVAMGRGQVRSELSSQWMSRPDDQRFLNLDDLHAAVKARADASEAHAVDVRTMRIDVRDNDPALYVEDRNGESRFENWSFGQMCSLLHVPAGYLRQLPPQIAGVNLQYALATFRTELVKTYRQAPDATLADIGQRLQAASGVAVNDPGWPQDAAGISTLRAITGPDYGRITDAEVVEAVRRIAGNGIGESRWKVPGVLDWGRDVYDPDVEVTKQSTTLYASDRDVWLFLVDDRNPIEIGKLADGSPDLVFRGFYVWNSEVGSKSLGIATMYLRAVCQNRLLWGVDGFQEIVMRHSKFAPDRFAAEAAPALESFSERATGRLMNGIADARRAVVARNDEERLDYLQRLKLSKAASLDIIATVTRDEGRPPESVWDFVQGITSKAGQATHQDERNAMERIGQRLLDKVAA